MEVGAVRDYDVVRVVLDDGHDNNMYHTHNADYIELVVDSHLGAVLVYEDEELTAIYPVDRLVSVRKITRDMEVKETEEVLQ